MVNTSKTDNSRLDPLSLNKTFPCDPPPISQAWVGRQAEIDILTDPSLRVVSLTGMGGQGKSALAGKYIDYLEEKTPSVYWDWRDCREQGDTLQTHLLRIIERLTNGQIKPWFLKDETNEKIIDLLFEVIGSKEIVFVFDNIDHYVDIEGNKPIYGMGYLLEKAIRSRHSCKFIFTCRPTIQYDSSQFYDLKLSGLSVLETQELFKIRGVSLDSHSLRRNIADVHTLTNGHPLWLNLIATQVSKNKANLSELAEDIRHGTNHDLPTTTLKSIWDTLTEKQKLILRYMAEAVRAETEDQLSIYVSREMTYNKFSKSLRVLKDLALIISKKTHNDKLALELHPVVKSFIRKEFTRSDRQTYIERIATVFDSLIDKLKSKISSETSFNILENWIYRTELALNAGMYEEALKSLNQVSSPLLASGHQIEFIRISKRLFSEIDFSTAIINEYSHFDDLLADYVGSLSYHSRFNEVELALKMYEQNLIGKTGRYVNLCDMKCYSYWLREDYDMAIHWGQKGVDLKEKENLDTSFDSSHNLALAQRDAGEIETALTYFLKGQTLDSVLELNSIDAEKGGHFYGNVGRCLWFKGETKAALLCYVKSLKLLEEVLDDKNTITNRGWANLWIAESLEKIGDFQNAYVFYLRACSILRTCSPSRAVQAEDSFKSIQEKNISLPKLKINDEVSINRFCMSWVSTHIAS